MHEPTTAGPLQGELDARRDALARRHPAWEPRTLDQFLAGYAAEFGDRPLVITDERTWTYGTSTSGRRAWPTGWRARGVRPGDHVGVVLANYPEFVPLKFAIARAGRGRACRSTSCTAADELAYVLAQSRCRTLVTMDRLRRPRPPGDARRHRTGRDERDRGPPRAPRRDRRPGRRTSRDGRSHARRPRAPTATPPPAARPGGRRPPARRRRRHPLHVRHDGLAQGRRRHPRRRVAHGVLVGVDAGVPGRPADPVLAALLPHVRLRRRAARRHVRRRGDHPAGRLRSTRLLRRHRAAPRPTTSCASRR